MTFAFAPLSYTLPYWPEHLFGHPGFLDRVGVSKFEIESAPDSLAMTGKLNILDKLETKLPALDGVTVAFFPDATGGFTEIPWRVDLVPDFAVTLTDLKLALRIESKLLHRVKQSGGKWVPDLDAQNHPKPVEITVSGATASVSGDGDIDVTGNPAIALTPMAIGETGIVIEATGIVLHLSDKAPPLPDAPPGFKGVAIDQIAVHLGDTFEGFGGPDDIKAGKLFIGSTGFSGTIEAEWTSPPTAGRLAGLPFTPKSIGISFAQNKLTGMSLEGSLTLPFFDHPLDVKVGYDANGGLTIGVDSSDGLFKLTKPNFLEVVVDSLEIDIIGKKAMVSICGEITPLYGGLPWPSFEVRSLSIDSDGHVKLDGGWIDLSAQKAMNFNAFTLQITKFGLGKLDGGGRWFGLSCKVNLIKGVEGKAEVDGLRLLLREGGGVGISLDGVGVEMKIAGAFELAGAVKFTDDGIDKRFDGGVTLSLKKPELLFDTQLTIGERNDSDTGEHFRYFAMYGGLELPTGIPLGASGVGLFGFAGLFALNMRPARKPASEPWYALPPGESWYHRDTPGVNKLTKWGPRKGATAFGAGLTLGTYADNGFTFNAKALLVVAFPGPLIMIEGRGNLLKDRKELAGSAEPLFRALAVLDEEAGEYTFGLDAYYKYDAGSGGVIDIRGSLEAYYKKSDPRAWHIWLGKKDPTASRIQAKIISLFQATSYFMIDASAIQTGAWIGYDKSWNPSPLSITLQAWLDANAKLSFKPNHFHADLWLHAAIELSAFGVGAGLSADALLSADIIDPFHILGQMSVTLELPWPLKDISRDVTLEWGPKPEMPPIPIVLQAVGLEHLRSAAVWPLAMGDTVEPSYDDGNGYLGNPNSGAMSAPPIVPMDARPSIAFGRAVHDDALIGLNAVTRTPEYDQIGDPAAGQGPAQVRFALKGIVLEKQPPGQAGWVAVAGRGAGADGLPRLYGSWGAIPSGNGPDAVDQTKLLLWSKTAFDQTRLTGDDWNDWFAEAYPNYPCVEAPPLTCHDFEGYEFAPVTNADGNIAHDFRHRDNPRLLFGSPLGAAVESLPRPVNGRTHVLRPLRGPAPGEVLAFALVDQPATRFMRVTFEGSAERTVAVVETDAAGERIERRFTTRSAELDIVADGPIQAVFVYMLNLPAGEFPGSPGAPDDDFANIRPRLGIVEICVGAGDPAVERRKALAENLKSGTSVWAAQGNVLEPYTDYRLVIATEAKVSVEGTARRQTSFAHFRTGGPPGLGGFTVLDSQTKDAIEGGPDNLANYVAQTVPATIGRGDDAPAMPRPVFRAYDVGVVFNADYVDLLYRMARRDLMLQILDSNGAPARDAVGRALSFENPWGVTSDLLLDNASVAWLAAVDPECVPIDQSTIAHNQTLGTSGTPLLLDPGTRCRARLVPLLLHEDFAAPHYADGAVAAGGGARIGDWLVVELDGAAQASRWTVHNSASANGIYVEQDLALAGGATAATDCPPGSALVWAPAAAPAWKCQRLTAFVNAAAGGAVGLLFLYQGANSYFELNLRPNDGVCRLVRRTPAGAVKLAEAPVAFNPGTDAELVVEVSDAAIRLFVDGVPALTHPIDLQSHTGGSVGLWCWDNAAARFKDVRVDDQSAAALASFGFEFVTSAYVNYAHLAHGRRTPVWDIETQGGDKDRTAAELAALASAAVTQSDAALSATEVRQYEDLAALWLGPGLVRDPSTPEVNVILRGGEALGWLIRSPEPWDWTRSEITLWRTAQEVPLSYLLGPIKIIGAALGMADGDDEFVDLLMLDDVVLAGWRLQMRDALGSATGLFEAPFDDPASLWSNLHQFAGQETVKAGLRLRLYSGGLIQAPADHTWHAVNIAAPGDPGVARLPAAGVDLRLLDSTGRTACAVRILPDTLFGPVQPAPRLLRKADATGLIVLPNAGAAIAPGAHRLNMIYRRDRSTTDPGSIVLSQAGDTSDEQAFVPLY